MERAILVEVNFQTGERAGNVDPRDPDLQSYRWQSLPSADGADLEIRLVEDDRSLEQYQDEPGVRILEGIEEIEKAIQRFIPPKYEQTASEAKLEEWAKNEGVNLSELPNQERHRLKEIHNRGGPVEKNQPPTATKMSNKTGWGKTLGRGNGLPDKSNGNGKGKSQ